MGTQFAAGKKAVGLCDRCGQKYKLRDLKELTIKARPSNLFVCPWCWEPDQPQLMLGTFPIDDPQALRNPRADLGAEASRNIQWGWNPVGGTSALTATGAVGTVTVVTT